jgi:hypothetical protein
MSSGQYGTKAFFEITFRFSKRTWVFYICSRRGQLVLESRDLSETEKKIIVVKPEQIHKITIIFTQNEWKQLSFCEFAHL